MGSLNFSITTTTITTNNNNGDGGVYNSKCHMKGMGDLKEEKY